MAEKLKYIGQASMDDYYRDFKGNTGFFTLDDFIYRAAVVVAEFYQKLFNQQYGENRQEKTAKDELVGFEQDLLLSQELSVKNNIAEIQYPVMSFLYDKSNCGYQFLLPVQPTDVKFERATLDQQWMFDYLPTSGRIFWYPQQGSLRLQKNSACTVNKVELLYVAAVRDKDGRVFEDAPVADGVVNYAITQTVSVIKGLSDQTVVKMANDMNENKTIETEINPKSRG